MRKKYASLEDKLPFWHLEDDGLMVYKDGSLGCGFELTGADIDCADNSSINDLATKLENLVVSAEEGTRIEFFYKLSSSNDSRIEEHKGISDDAPVEYTPVRNSRSQFLSRRVVNGGIFSLEILCFFRGKPHVFSKRPWWKSQQAFESITENEFKHHRNKFLRLKNRMAASLEHAGLAPQDLTAKEWFKPSF